MQANKTKSILDSWTARQVVRRTCTKDIDINLFIVDHVCMDASDGKGHMCFCETNLCNAARNPHSAAASSLWMFISFVVLLLPLFTPNQASQSIESNRIDRNHFWFFQSLARSHRNHSLLYQTFQLYCLPSSSTPCSFSIHIILVLRNINILCTFFLLFFVFIFFLFHRP